MSDKDEDIIAINENELMKDYGFSGMFGKLRLTALERKQLNDLRFPEKREW